MIEKQIVATNINKMPRMFPLKVLKGLVKFGTNTNSLHTDPRPVPTKDPKTKHTRAKQFFANESTDGPP